VPLRAREPAARHVPGERRARPCVAYDANAEKDMADAVIENPILNSPFSEPMRHWRFGDTGITNEIVEGRRPSSYFMPIPASKIRGKQLQLADPVDARPNRGERARTDATGGCRARWAASYYSSTEAPDDISSWSRSRASVQPSS